MIRILAVLRFSLTCVLLLVAFPPALVLAEEDEKQSWVGQTVFWSPYAQARIGNRVVDASKLPFPATIERVEGDWVWIGNAWLREEHVMFSSEAIDYYTDIIADDPRDADAWSNRGVARQEEEDLEKAFEDFNEAIRLAPRNASAFLNRGKAWFAKEEYARAIDDCTTAIRLAPKSFAAYTQRGLAWERKGDLDKAIADHTTAIDLAPRDPVAFNNRGDAWLGKNDLDEAIADYTKAVRRDPEFFLAYRNRAYAYGLKNDLDAAIRDCDEALRIHPKYAPAFYDRGYARQLQGDYEKAAADLSEAVNLDPDSSSYNNGLAMLLATCPNDDHRNGKKAVELATKACEKTNWQYPAFIETLAAACAEDGQFAKAVKWQQKALDMTRKEADAEKGRKRLELYKAGKAFREEGGK